MKEQPLFAPGDRVVCVDSKGNTGLVEGREYTIKSIKRRSCCGGIVVDVGLILDTTSQLCTCGVTIVPDHHKRQTRFVPVDFDRYAEETFHQSLKGKPVNA